MAKVLLAVCTVLLLGSAGALRAVPSTGVGENQTEASHHWVLGLDHDGVTIMAVDLSKAAGDLPGPGCEKITCGDLRCPAGFSPKKSPSMCCPVCVNPNLEVPPPPPSGVTGKYGGKPSTAPDKDCRGVYCFPTMCAETKLEKGMCCPRCVTR